MFVRPAIAGDRTVYTSELAGATLDDLLDAAEDDCWPSNRCDAEWALLRNWAIQTECLMIDEAEDTAWEQQMRELSKLDLPYAEWVEARGQALCERVRARKLAQTRLRDRYGFKRPRRWRLVAKDVRRLYRLWSSDEESPTEVLAS